MAQTKEQKRLKALSYWLGKLATAKERSFDRENISYIISQIDILSKKLEPTNPGRICAGCQERYFLPQYYSTFCPRCDDSFSKGLSRITESFMQLSEVINKASPAVAHFRNIILNSRYGK